MMSVMSCSDASIASRTDSINNSAAHGKEDLRFVVVGKTSQNNRQLQRALTFFRIPVISSDDGLDFVHDVTHDNVFLLSDFSEGHFHVLRDSHARILGPSVVVQAADMDQPLPNNTRPLYCNSMKGQVVCFTGFKQKSQLSKLADYVHHMGGSIRKDFSSSVTHLVANNVGGDKYRIAVSLGTPILSLEWVLHAWQRRDEPNFVATDNTMVQYRMKTFYNCCLSFIGFPEDEQKHMEEETVKNGGSHRHTGEPGCTHLVVEEHSVKEIIFETHSKLKKVKSEWFWASIQMEACAEEDMYLFKAPSEATAPSNLLGVTPKVMSGSRTRKRKLLRDNLANLASAGEMDSPFFQMKRQSGEFLSMSASMFDLTPDTSLHNLKAAPRAEHVPPSADAGSQPKITARQQVVMELLQTETNYVGILHTVLELFKKEIEDPDQRGGPLLGSTDVKLIFGTIPSIYAVHCVIRDELEEIVTNWREDRVIGEVITKHADALMKAYPPFVNFFENAKSTIEKCDRENARFHAFLMKCRTRPECNRQSLKELLIRPVQRLPSVGLLINDILKHTKRESSDHKMLLKSADVLKEVMTHINEDRRKTEGQLAMFDIINDIDNCPPNLLSSHRQFIARVDTVEITDALSGKGDSISLFVFSDSIELCKRRSKGNFKSPAIIKTPQKAYKHIDLLSLSAIKRVVDIQETEEFKNVFALVVRPPTFCKEALFGFAVTSDDFRKEDFLRQLCKLMADSVCRTDYENLLASMSARDLDLSIGDVYSKSKVSRFGKRVSRAFSFKQTPRKLKRAMSSISQVMASPFIGDQSTEETSPCVGQRIRLATTADIADAFISPAPSINGELEHLEGDDLDDMSEVDDTEGEDLENGSAHKQPLGEVKTASPMLTDTPVSRFRSAATLRSSVLANKL